MSNVPTRRYPQTTWTFENARNTFLRQMADHARGEQLKQLRNALGKSQEEIAHKLKVTAKTYGKWEGGGPIRGGNARLLAKYFKVPASNLVEHEIATPDVLTSLNGDGKRLLEQLDRIERKLDELLKQREPAKKAPRRLRQPTPEADQPKPRSR